MVRNCLILPLSCLMRPEKDFLFEKGSPGRNRNCLLKWFMN